MSEVVVVAILPAAKGKEQRLQDLLDGMTKKVKENEPACLRYHCHKSVEDGATEFVMVETYKDQAAFDAHKETPYFKEFFKTATDEQCMGPGAKIVPCKSVAGYEMR